MFDWYPDYEHYCARAQLILFTLGMGMTLSLADFIEIVRRPRVFATALLGQVLLGPLVAVVINALTDFEPGIKVGLILVAAMPGGALAKFFTYFGRGNMALSISLTGVTTILTIFTVPLLLYLLTAQHFVDFDMPVADILIDVALCLLLPLIAGLTISRQWPSHHRLLSKICIRIGLAVVIVMIAGSLGSGRIHPRQYGLGVPIAIILFCLLGQQLIMLPFRFFGWPRQDRMAAGIEITMRNMNLALLIKANLFAPTDELGDAVLFVILFYAGAAMCIGFPQALNHNRMARSESCADASGSDSPKA